MYFLRMKLIWQYINHEHIIPTCVTSTVCVISIKTVKIVNIIIQYWWKILLKYWWNMIISGIKFALAWIITNMFCQFWKKCYIHFRIISNPASNFGNASNFTPHENNLLLRIFPVNDMQATLPSPPFPTTSKSSRNASNKKRAILKFTKKVMDFKIWKLWIFWRKEIFLKKCMLGVKIYDRLHVRNVHTKVPFP